MIKKILIALGLIVILAVVAVGAMVALGPTAFRSEREVVINKPKAEVFAYVKQIRNQNQWGPRFKKDPGMKQEDRGTDGEPGFVTHWTSRSEEVGEGEQEITRVVDGERVDTELRFIRPFESKADAYIVTETVNENQTRVKWGFTGDMPRPMNVFLILTDIDAMVGKDFEEGLNSLKVILEAK